MKIKYFYSASLAGAKCARLLCYTHSDENKHAAIFLGDASRMERLEIHGGSTPAHLDALAKTFPITCLKNLAFVLGTHGDDTARKYAIGLIADLGAGKFDIRPAPDFGGIPGVDPATIEPGDLYMDAFFPELTPEQRVFLDLCRGGSYSIKIPVKVSRSGLTRKLALPEQLANLYAAAGGKVRHLDSWIFPGHFLATVQGFGFSATLQIAEWVARHVFPGAAIPYVGYSAYPFSLSDPMYVLDQALDARDVKSF